MAEPQTDPEVMRKRRAIRILLFFLLLFPLCNFYYDDVNSNIRQGMNVWEALFSGRFFQYYSVNVESQAAGQMTHLANYGMILNIVNGIWQLPLYIIEKIAGGNILEHFAARIWGKLLMYVAMWTSAFLFRKLAVQTGLKEDKAERAMILYLTSSLVILSALNASQIDVVGMNFILLAMYYLIRDEQKKFLLFLILAVQFKDFAWLVFLPVLLLKEKNLLKLGATLAAPFLFSAVTGIPFSLADPAGVASRKSRIWIQIDWLTRSRVNLVGGIEIPVVFLALGALCMYAYFKVLTKEEEKDRIRWYLYMAAAAMLPIMICTYSNAHWCIYFVPFYLLLLLHREDRFFIRLLLEMAGTLSLTVAYFVEWWGVFGGLDGMLADRLIAKDLNTLISAEQISEFLKQEKYFQFWTLAFAAFIVWAVCFLIFNHPSRVAGQKEVSSGDLWTDGNKQSITALICLRAFAALVICNAMAILTFAQSIF